MALVYTMTNIRACTQFNSAGGVLHVARPVCVWRGLLLLYVLKPLNTLIHSLCTRMKITCGIVEGKVSTCHTRQQAGLEARLCLLRCDRYIAVFELASWSGDNRQEHGSLKKQRAPENKNHFISTNQKLASTWALAAAQKVGKT